MQKLIQRTAKRITKRLDKHEIPYKRIDSNSTHSVYFRLYGLGAIRISDHKSKRDAQFNLLADTYQFHYKGKKFYYPIYNVDDCVRQVLRRQEILSRE